MKSFHAIRYGAHETADVVRQVSIAAVAPAFTENPAIFTDRMSSRRVIRRDKNAWRTRAQMQRKV
ncbi:hypothetical protein [Burkholderia seminalis]|uniref:Uncharacterized protein n=1 Tax=Burkholderia seminalis TaxID=488731 RepID=A0A8A8D5F4_9BURK|nr:hypothetical protein [Burkholderia seminalis]QTO19958.1 hypothetical protein DT99_006940 [Burkholderia seminalis]